jgi:putrescine importer
VLLTAWLWTSLSPSALMAGGVWLAIGFVYLLILTRGFRKPTPMLDLAE